MSGIDAYSATRNLIENTFSYLTWHEDICDQVGFKGISQVWIEDPAWYFWLNHVEGAFLLRLHADESMGENHYVSLSLHYFPTAGENAYHSLNAVEKKLISDSTVFDFTTGTPKFEAYDQFISLFVVAEIGFVIDADNHLQVLLYSSEQKENHSCYEFVDLLVSSLNFQSKQHHNKAFSFRSGMVNTTLLSYSGSALQQFRDEFNLDADLFEIIVPDARLNRWLRAAHMDAVCSVNGACSCSH
ncbi:hypothetical protein [uncultured Desulfuromusa sp.]|uniref:hypothetical protein n=1 Tax=uncultured Desulfuromusa sp. TaxID=219183 RepID=UPI002AA6DC74|nr:hypothetical protein [uncultured Desulfuromusa sp.]